ncbi:MAG: hypothetical protein IT459_01940 [Planctomycetes bacterium]|nr:hypothetical protein [Planctomycetota bacterium]
MTRAPYFVGLDLGTSAVKAIVFDSTFRAIHGTRLALTTTSGDDGRSEQDPDLVFRIAARALARAITAVGAHRVRAIGLAAHRSSATLLEPVTATFHAPLVLWNDRRSADVATRLADSHRGALLARASGLPVLPFTFACRALWMRQQPRWRHALASGRVKLVTADVALAHVLTGGAAFATDPSFSARTQLAKVRDGAWSDALLRAAGVERAWLAPVLPTLAARGATSARCARGLPAGIPILASVADQSASAIGLGLTAQDVVGLTFGTGAFAVRVGARRDRDRGRFPIVLVGRGEHATHAVEANDPSTGTSIARVAEWLDVRDAAELERLARAHRDDTLVFVPAVSGLGAPWLAPNARAAWSGLHAGTTRADLAEAALRGVALRASELVDELDPSGRRAVLVAGGGATHDAMLQRLADVSGRTIRRAATSETTARGAALLTALACTGSGDRGGLDDLADARVRCETDASWTPRTTQRDRSLQRRRFANAVTALLSSADARATSRHGT